jgi:hypothetical protein
MRKASDEPTRNRIADTNEDNGEGPGRLLGGWTQRRRDRRTASVP